MGKILIKFKNYTSIFFGLLLFLEFLKYLSSTNNLVLSTGIIGVIISIFYLVSGAIKIFIDNTKNKLTNDVLNVITIFLFPLFFIFIIIVNLINLTSINLTGWTISIFSIIISFVFLSFYIISKCYKKIFIKINYLFSFLFILILLLNILFNGYGNSISLGNIDVVSFIIYVLYSSILINSLIEDNKISDDKNNKDYNAQINNNIDE